MHDLGHLAEKLLVLSLDVQQLAVVHPVGALGSHCSFDAVAFGVGRREPRIVDGFLHVFDGGFAPLVLQGDEAIFDDTALALGLSVHLK